MVSDILSIITIAIFSVLFLLATLGAYVYHIIWWIALAMNNELDTGGEIVLAILGTILPLIGWIHGWYLWLT